MGCSQRICRHLTSCHPGFESHAHNLRFFQFIFVSCGKDENKQKEAGSGIFFKKNHYLEKESLNHSRVFAFLLIDHGVEQMSGRDSLISQSLRSAHQPHEHVRDGVLRLQKVYGLLPVANLSTLIIYYSIVVSISNLLVIMTPEW